MKPAAMRLAFLQLCFVVLLCDKEDIVLSPGNAVGPEVGLILVQGAEIHTKAYVPLAQQIQANTGMKVWVGIPVAGINNEANPAQIGGAINRILSSMKSKGMTTE